MGVRQKYTVTRDLTPEECPWLHETVKAGTIVYYYNGPTYGCVDWAHGMAVTLDPNSDTARRRGDDRRRRAEDEAMARFLNRGQR